MRINIHEIPPSGKDYCLTKADSWVAEVINRAGFECYDNFSSRIHVVRNRDNVVFSGTMNGGIKLICSRCCEPYSFVIDRDFLSTYCRYYERRGAIREEVKLTKGDLDLTFFNGEEIDLAELLNEQLQLAMPYRPVCREDCKGICSYCGKDLNFGDCNCEKRNWGLKLSSLLSNVTPGKAGIQD
ncbi:MAG: hypothetical protein A3F16_03885 [Deltaproteobacteria bacterium RIFCSPHIGHO2_12_FULL_43_9]|nr:MAG: hypothetical protein A3F16_03885 [Deltaproteobacteria bacterium RIFCSPHIGHO2_12_FULL_43_9]